ncbi:MAG: hypothetical protein AB1679_00760 [Actinomycetota bacterium]
MAEGLLEYASKEWCERAVEVWNETVVPNLVDPEHYHYTVEFGETASGKFSQLNTEYGKVLTWEPGKHIEEECDFVIWATPEIYEKIGEGKLDPVGAVASKRVHVRRGPMPVIIKEADAFKKLLIGLGQIPTAW